jgi:UDP-glucose 4-epimerase
LIGNAFAQELSAKRQVICLSRKKSRGDDVTAIQGEFHSFEDLRQLDSFDISCVVHLAAVTGGCSEEEGLAVNVLGTRRLLRYALDRGCRKFVLASSIAAAGCLSDAFLPLQLPIPDEHPCLAYDAYGFSKAMMEELTRYFHRVVPDSDFINLRIGLVDSTDVPHLFGAGDPLGWPFVNLARITLGDLLRALDCAVAAPPQPGVRVFNVVTARANCSDPVPAVLRSCLGDRAERLDLSRYESPGHSYDALYAMDNIQRALGFFAEESTSTQQVDESPRANARV